MPNEKPDREPHFVYVTADGVELDADALNDVDREMSDEEIEAAARALKRFADKIAEQRKRKK